MVNDFFVAMAAGVREDVYYADVPGVRSWLADPVTEAHFRQIWPHMHAATAETVRKIRLA